RGLPARSIAHASGSERPSPADHRSAAPRPDGRHGQVGLGNHLAALVQLDELAGEIIAGHQRVDVGHALGRGRLRHRRLPDHLAVVVILDHLVHVLDRHDHAAGGQDVVAEVADVLDAVGLHLLARRVQADAQPLVGDEQELAVAQLAARHDVVLRAVDGDDLAPAAVNFQDLVAGGDDRVAVGQPLDAAGPTGQLLLPDLGPLEVPLGDAAGAVLGQQDAVVADHLGILDVLQPLEPPALLAVLAQFGDDAVLGDDQDGVADQAGLAGGDGGPLG